jgi:AcrR family transcriptional regulator
LPRAKSQKPKTVKPSPKTKPSAAQRKVPRKRRTPEQARTELLDAAERLLSEHGPDAIGLRDVAREARVSHGLITHYFKTYEGLVEAVFARRTERLAQTVVGTFRRTEGQPDVTALVQLLLALVSEPMHLRLVAWATLSGRAQSVDYLPGRAKALRAIADATRQAAEREAERLGVAVGSQEQIDYAIILTLGAAYGYGLGKVPFFNALNRTPDSTTDTKVMECLVSMLRSVLLPRA